MSKQLLEDVFIKMKDCQAWSLQLLQIKNTAKHGSSYLSREIELTPNTKVIEYIKSLSEHYCSERGIGSFSSVDAYTGDIVDHVVYKIGRDNELIKAECDSLINRISDPDRECPITSIKPNSLIIKGAIIINDDGEETPVTLAFMQKPVSILTNKFLWTSSGKFHELEEPILTLRNTVDVVIIGKTVYFFSLAGENLFNMERTYSAICKSRVDEIAQYEFLTDADVFKSVAVRGQNPRRFVSFNPAHLDALKDAKRRKLIAKKFSLPLKNGCLDTSDTQAVEKLVKFLCNKAMLDPCDESPMEVAATKPWAR